MSRNTGPTRAIRQQVIDRDCRFCRRCWRHGTEIHHRIGRGAGGTSRPIVNDLSALVLLCHDCHREITENPTLAYETGWSIRRSSSELPSEVPLVDIDAHVFFLTEEGSVVHGFMDLRRSQHRTGEGGGAGHVGRVPPHTGGQP